MEEKKKPEEKTQFRIDGNLIVSPKTTRKLYGKKKLYPDEPIPEEKVEDPNMPVSDEIEWKSE